MTAQAVSRTVAFTAAAALLSSAVMADEKASPAPPETRPDQTVPAPVVDIPFRAIPESSWRLTSSYEREDFNLQGGGLSLHTTARSRMHFTLTSPDSHWNAKAGLNVGNTQSFPGVNRDRRIVDQFTLGYTDRNNSLDLGYLPEQTKLAFMDDRDAPPAFRAISFNESLYGLEGLQFKTGFCLTQHWCLSFRGIGGRSIERNQKNYRDAARFLLSKNINVPEATRRRLNEFLDQSLEKGLTKLDQLRTGGVAAAGTLPARLPTLDEALSASAEARTLLKVLEQIAQGRSPQAARQIHQLAGLADESHIRNIYSSVQTADLPASINQLHHDLSNGAMQGISYLKTEVAGWKDKDILNVYSILMSNNPLQTLLDTSGIPQPVSLPDRPISIGNTFNQVNCPNVDLPIVGTLSSVSNLCDVARSVAPGQTGVIDGYIQDARNLEFNPADYNDEVNALLSRQLNAPISNTMIAAGAVGITRYAGSKLGTNVLVSTLDLAAEGEADRWAYATEASLRHHTSRSDFEFSVGGGRTRGNEGDAIQTFAGCAIGGGYRITENLRTFARVQAVAFRNYRTLDFESMRKNSIYGIATAYVGTEYAFNPRWSTAVTYGQSAEILMGYAEHFNLSINHRRGGLRGNLSVGYIQPKKTVLNFFKNLDWYDPQLKKPAPIVSANIVYNFDIISP